MHSWLIRIKIVIVKVEVIHVDWGCWPIELNIFIYGFDLELSRIFIKEDAVFWCEIFWTIK